MMSDSRSRAIGANQHLGADCRLVGELQHDTVDVLFVAAHAAGHTVRELKQRFRTSRQCQMPTGPRQTGEQQVEGICEGMAHNQTQAWKQH